MQIIVDKYVIEMVKWLNQSKNSGVRVVLQVRIEVAFEDPTTWDVEAWQRILADFPGGQPEKKQEEKNT